MVSLSNVPIEKVERKHYLLIKQIFTERLERLRKSKRKLLFDLIDIDTAMQDLFLFEHSYLVGGYLVVYDVDRCWGLKDQMLNEIIVVRLAPGCDFSVVPTFLERQARAAGCRYVVAGTALAKDNRALAALYQRNGFSLSHMQMMKEL